MRHAVALAALLIATPAQAGGLGPLVMGGFHTEPLWFYTNAADGGNGPRIQSIAEYEQYKQTQVLGQVGTGLELILGDRDDLVQGAFRFFWMGDLPQVDPAKGASDDINPDAIVASWRTDLRHVGVGTIGLHIGFFRAANDNFKLAATLHVGTGFITSDATEFFLVQPGIAASYQVRRAVELFAEVDYGARIRKRVGHGLYVNAGVRILFD